MALSFTARKRSWVFTLYNPTAYDEMLIHCIGANYGVYAFNPNSMPYITGFVRYDNARTIRILRKKLPGAVWSPSIGKLSDNRDHVISEGKFVEFARNVHGEVVVVSDLTTVLPAPRALRPCTSIGHARIPCCTFCQLM